MAIDFSSARAAIRKEHLSLRFDDVLTEPFQLRWVPAMAGRKTFDTACWCWLPKGTPPSHLITFGEKLADKCVNKASLPEYALAYYRHEVEHALSTVRDLKAIGEKCKAHGIAFDLMNLAEDARIESLARTRWDKRFEWLRYEEKGKDESAAGLLFQIIQADGDVETVRLRAAGNISVEKIMARVGEFYFPRFLAASSTWGLIPLLALWVAEFGNPPSSGGGSDLGQGAALAEDKAALAALLSASEDIAGGDGPKGVPTGRDNTGSAPIDRQGNHDFSSHGERTSLESNRIEVIAGILRAAFRQGREKVSSMVPSRRLNFKAIVRGSEKIYRHEVTTGSGRKPRVRYYHDCSSSMHGSPQVEGLYLLAAINQLAAAGCIDAYLTLTMGCGGKALRETFKLPVPTEVIEKIPAVGDSECFKHAFHATRALVEPADLVRGYSDGDICDDKVDQSQWRSRGLFSVGLYVGKDQSDRLRAWFVSGLCRESTEGLALELATLLKQRGEKAR